MNSKKMKMIAALATIAGFATQAIAVGPEYNTWMDYAFESHGDPEYGNYPEGDANDDLYDVAKMEYEYDTPARAYARPEYRYQTMPEEHAYSTERYTEGSRLDENRKKLTARTEPQELLEQPQAGKRAQYRAGRYNQDYPMAGVSTNDRSQMPQMQTNQEMQPTRLVFNGTDSSINNETMARRYNGVNNIRTMQNTTNKKLAQNARTMQSDIFGPQSQAMQELQHSRRVLQQQLQQPTPGRLTPTDDAQEMHILPYPYKADDENMHALPYTQPERLQPTEDAQEMHILPYPYKPSQPVSPRPDEPTYPQRPLIGGKGGRPPVWLSNNDNERPGIISIDNNNAMDATRPVMIALNDDMNDTQPMARGYRTMARTRRRGMSQDDMNNQSTTARAYDTYARTNRRPRILAYNNEMNDMQPMARRRILSADDYSTTARTYNNDNMQPMARGYRTMARTNRRGMSQDDTNNQSTTARDWMRAYNNNNNYMRTDRRPRTLALDTNENPREWLGSHNDQSKAGMTERLEKWFEQKMDHRQGTAPEHSRSPQAQGFWERVREFFRGTRRPEPTRPVQPSHISPRFQPTTK